MVLDPLFCLRVIAQAIFDKKGSNILVLDLRKISNLTEYVIIAEGDVNKHVKALADEVVTRAERVGLHPVYLEGRRDGEWVVIDFSFITVHLFQPAWREKYELEALWKEGEIVDVPIDTHAPAKMAGYSSVT